MTKTSRPVPGTLHQPFVFACPVCQEPLEVVAPQRVWCPVDELTFECREGIWRFLPPERAAALAQFRREYETVRRNEVRGSDNPAFYRMLPFVMEKSQQISQIKKIFSLRALRPLRLNSDWMQRARSFKVLVDRVVRPLEVQLKRPLRILDLGAGNGWLSNRLAQRGHVMAAVDLGVDEWDGLGASRHYETKFTCLQAEFDHLPLEDNQVDLAIFNASFHYSVNYEVTLREALRVLRPEGKMVVLDTAVYQHQSSGQQMVAEREAAFLQQHGFASNALPSENFLTYGRIQELASTVNVNWQLFWPVPAWRRLIRQLKVKLRRQREPAKFPLIMGQANSP